AHLYVQQATKDFFDSGLSVYADIFKTSAVVSKTVAAGATANFGPGFGALVVATTNPDGSTEANATRYPLFYDAQASDPLVTMENTNPSRTSWPNTQDCLTITLQ
ncbi:MAG TPA: hypothetical protein VFQ39_09880, partial [Longimicrobium sp.]|nr:hypothetical protein [Longimicrobium sp.]